MSRLHTMHRPEAGITLISRWETGTEERSRAAADALLAGWPDRPDQELWQHIFIDLDGSGLLFCSQWTSAEAHLEFARSGRAAAIRPVDELVPGIERPGLNRTRLGPGVVPDEVRAPAVTAVGFLPGGSAEAAAAQLSAAPPAGLLAAHFHSTLDDSQVIVLSEWATDDIPPAFPADRRYRLFASASR
ncbi:hypothetical protein [Streptomyces orinoci]|uniref:Antibiotic biosynthesis monooxygenase n=1 Tax=Streptomyces orinoci TaxID=67339 RepID=A0ABV3K622_STRON|nr:hypothetical protein [Streptomyces orinoci]